MINTVNSKPYYNQSYNYVKEYKPVQDSIFVRQKIAKPKKITYKEGFKLVATGLKDKVVGMVKSIVKHPIKTLGAMALTTAALAALPLIGVSMATGGAIMVVGFGSLAIFNTAKNIYKARKNSKNGNYDEARKNLKNLGGNIVDLALTLPFMPKALKHLKRNVPLYMQRDLIHIKNPDGSIPVKVKKYRGGTAVYEYNADGSLKGITNKESLLSKIKNAKTWKERYNLLTEQDSIEAMYEQINEAYKQVAKERGVASVRDIEFKTIPVERFAVRDLKTGKIKTKESELSGWVESESFNSNVVHAKANTGVEDMAGIIGHEHRHVEQNQLMARAEGLLEEDNPLKVAFAHDRGCDVIRKTTIKKGTPEWELAKKYYDAHKNYVSAKKNPEAYKNNFLEVDARNVGETEVASQIMAKLRANMGISESAKIAIDSAKYSPVKDLIFVNGFPILNQNS